VTTSDALRLAATIGLVVVVARLLGGLARRLKQPAVAGEIVAGVLLGPTLLGWAAPSPTLEALGRVAAGLFLLAAGMEVDLSTLRRERRTAAYVGLAGLALPCSLGFAVAWAAPETFGFHASDRADGALFFGIALSISALPVIARTLMNLGLYRTDFGVAVIAAAVLDDVVGWSLFALLVARLPAEAVRGLGPAWTLPLVAALVVVMLTVVRHGADRALPRIAPRVGAVGVVALSSVLAFAVGAVAHWSGVHAMFGAFLVGIALGDSAHLPARSRSLLGGAVDGFVAPLFFGAIGLKVDFARHFDGALCALVLGIACAAKVLGCALGARVAGMPPRRAWAFGFAMNSRGAMEIMLAMLALEAGLIGPPMLVALVLMAVVTSLMAGPVVRALLGRPPAATPATSGYTPPP
jgi:Kef-type K+ transport system membrane component KefB